jgi:hypothetical protein
MVKIKKDFNIQVLSPKVTNASHLFMKEDTNKLFLVNNLEIYCLLLTPDDFEAYKSMNTVENKWGWGVDFLFGYFKISAAICSYYEVNHELSGQCNSMEARILMNNYLKNLGFNVTNYNSDNTLNYIKNKYPPKIKKLDYKL